MLCTPKHRPSPRPPSHRPRSRRRARPRVEELEARTVLSVAGLDGLTAVPAVQLVAPNFSPGQPLGAYYPSQIRHAYGFDQLTADGTGQTIAIVDAYDDPNIASDLAVFDQQFGLPGTDAAGVSAFFTKVNQNGNAGPLPAVDAGWAGEIALDVEWAHAIAPGAKILLVEANSASLGDLLTAVDTARHAQGVVAVSMSWGGGEFGTESFYDSYFKTPTGHPGVTFVASSGDAGAYYGLEWPSASPNVLSVGGTSVRLDANDNVTAEPGWAYSGGGSSGGESRPSYQSNYLNGGATNVSKTLLKRNRRLNPDVSYNADLSAASPGVAIYDSVPYQGQAGWFQAGGTSAGAPQWAALVALADQLRGSAGSLDGATQTLYAVYKMARSGSGYFRDVTSGSNGYAAGAGYDLVTGLGSPHAELVVPYLAGWTGTGLTGSGPALVSAASATSGAGHHALVASGGPEASSTDPGAATPTGAAPVAPPPRTSERHPTGRTEAAPVTILVLVPVKGTAPTLLVTPLRSVEPPILPPGQVVSAADAVPAGPPTVLLDGGAVELPADAWGGAVSPPRREAVSAAAALLPGPVSAATARSPMAAVDAFFALGHQDAGPGIPVTSQASFALAGPFTALGSAVPAAMVGLLLGGCRGDRAEEARRRRLSLQR